VAQGDEVEPATATGATGGCAVFLTLFADLVTDFVILLGGERAFADAGGVGFADAEGVINISGADAGAKACAASRGVAGGYVWISAVVEVEEGALGAFEQDAVVAADGFLEDMLGIADVGGDPLCVAAVFVVEVFELNGFSAEESD